MAYPTLLQETDLGPVSLRNRIMSSGHQTTLVEDYLPTEDFFAYHRARAQGGAGLIVLEAHSVHESGLLTDHTIDASRDAIVDEYRPFAEEINSLGTKLFCQLFHGGRERYSGDYAPPAPAPSDTPTERLHVIPCPMETDEVYEMIEAYADAAERMDRAGLDGVEIVGSHSYLPAQFWNPSLNDRSDEFGGSLENRCRFTVEIADRIRDRVSDDFTVGIRLSAEEKHKHGLSLEETLPIIQHLDEAATFDYWSVVVGSSSTHKGCSYIVPPASEDRQIVRSPGEAVASVIESPLILTSRINTPAKGEEMVSDGPADVVGMTRALIADPDMPAKAAEGRESDILPCVSCNQGCIGRYQEELPIRCTMNPVTGREREFRTLEAAESAKEIAVIGGGPAGLVAASTAAERGHEVTLFEQRDVLGGKIRTYADLDHRGAYGEWVEAMVNRLEAYEVDIERGVEFDPGQSSGYDVYLLAIGSHGRKPDITIDDDAHAVTAVEALENPEELGESIVVSDWDGNWSALDLASTLGSEHDIEVITSAYTAGESVQQYRQNQLLAKLDELDVTLTPHHRVREVKESNIELENLFSESVDERHGVDTVVFAHGGEADYSLYRNLVAEGAQVERVGDCWAPRSLDEAVWEGFKAATEI
ncbi:FAD-dependent oxidoreductase [Natronorubrum sp. FCH18a]|uniref:oxidoreductase n=1 Tax=Natronorubrum sp. FCH18a TaxID=3447018 RepID=UPI003F50F2A5